MIDCSRFSWWPGAAGLFRAPFGLPFGLPDRPGVNRLCAGGLR